MRDVRQLLAEQTCFAIRRQPDLKFNVLHSLVSIADAGFSYSYFFPSSPLLYFSFSIIVLK